MRDGFNRPTDIAWDKAGNIFVSDGYNNSRAIKFDKNGRYVAEVGVRGAEPTQMNTPHSIQVDNDGNVYVADRGNSRIQVFSLDGKFLKQAFVTRDAKSSSTTGGLSFSHDPGQTFLYVADQGNSKVHILLRETLEEVGSFGQEGKEPGNFIAPHQLATDLNGNLYTVEVKGGERAQRFLFKGYKPKTVSTR